MGSTGNEGGRNQIVLECVSGNYEKSNETSASLIRIPGKKFKNIRKTLILVIALSLSMLPARGFVSQMSTHSRLQLYKEVSYSFILLSIHPRGLNNYYALGEGSVGPRTIGTRGNKDEIPAYGVILASSQSP